MTLISLCSELFGVYVYFWSYVNIKRFHKVIAKIKQYNFLTHGVYIVLQKTREISDN